MKLKNFKTPCCKSGFYRKGRADYRCTECDKDVTLELVFFSDLIEESKNETKSDN